MKEVCKKEYSFTMGNVMDEGNWEGFAKVKYPDEEKIW